MNDGGGLPGEVKNFLGWVLMLGTGAWLGFLTGTGVLPYEPTAVVVMLIALVFIGWAISNEDPAKMTDESDS